EQTVEWDPHSQDGSQPITVDVSPSAGNVPAGIRSGNYTIYPSAGVAVVYDDNIFASDTNRVSDFRSEITPSVRLKSSLPRHVFDFSLDGKIVSYFDNTDQDYANYRARADSALHFDAAHTISISASSLLEHEEQSDALFTVGAAEPIPRFEHSAAVGITRDVGRLYGTLAAGFTRRDYSDVRDTLGGTLDQDSRDTDTWTAQFSGGYRFSPGFEIVSILRTSRIENRGNDVSDRDAWNYEVLAGLAFETNPLLKWRILGGYGVRDYDDAGLEPLETLLLQADVQWSPTRRLTVYGTLYQQIEEAFDSTSNGVIRQGANIRGEYEIYHNLFLRAGTEYRQDDFNGSGRTDDVYAANIGLQYYLNKNWLFTFDYEHQVRDSTEDLLDMHRNRFRVGARLRF
ncbi:MAG: outer membrane beta-barrel protein, partial [Myxococcota bacterium]